MICVKFRIFYPELYYSIYEIEADTAKEAARLFLSGDADAKITVGDHICGAEEITEYDVKDKKYHAAIDTGGSKLIPLDNLESYPSLETVREHVQTAIQRVIALGKPVVILLNCHHDLFIMDKECFKESRNVESFYVIPLSVDLDTLCDDVYFQLCGM
jgi:hypothetical protein